MALIQRCEMEIGNWILVMIASHSCYRFVVCSSMMRISHCSTSQGPWWPLSLVTTHCHVQKPDWDYLSLESWHGEL